MTRKLSESGSCSSGESTDSQAGRGGVMSYAQTHCMGEWVAMSRRVTTSKKNFGDTSIVFAPEPCFYRLFKQSFRTYVTADLSARGVDYAADLRKLPFRSESFDFL
jgi:hypothetical protein